MRMGKNCTQKRPIKIYLKPGMEYIWLMWQFVKTHIKFSRVVQDKTEQETK